MVDAVVVWRADLYWAEAKRQLSDTSSYLPLDQDLTDEAIICEAIILMTISNFITSGCLLATASNLIVLQPHPVLPSTKNP